LVAAPVVGAKQAAVARKAQDDQIQLWVSSGRAAVGDDRPQWGRKRTFAPDFALRKSLIFRHRRKRAKFLIYAPLETRGSATF
jgi:hypothetical protein